MAPDVTASDHPKFVRSHWSDRRAVAEIAKEVTKADHEAHFGRQVAREIFAARDIVVYSGGFVTVSKLRAGEPQRLISIEATADVGKTSGLGRGLAAGMSHGVHPLGANRRADVYLTVTTDWHTYALRESPPTAGCMTRSRTLEAAGIAAIVARATASEHERTTGGLRVQQRLVQLQDLLTAGLIDEGEFEAKRQALLRPL